MNVEMQEIIDRLENLKISDNDIDEFKGVLTKVINLYEDTYDNILDKLRNEKLTQEQIRRILQIFREFSSYVYCFNHIGKDASPNFELIYRNWKDYFDGGYIETFNHFIKAYADGCRMWKVDPFRNDHWIWIDGNGEFCVYHDDDMQDFFYRMIDDEKDIRTMRIEDIKDIFRIING